MYLHLGQAAVISDREIVGIFDLDNSSWAYKTREFLDRAQTEGRVRTAGEDLPRSFVLLRNGQVVLSQLSTAALKGRAENGRLE